MTPSTRRLVTRSMSTHGGDSVCGSFRQPPREVKTISLDYARLSLRLLSTAHLSMLVISSSCVAELIAGTTR